MPVCNHVVTTGSHVSYSATVEMIGEVMEPDCESRTIEFLAEEQRRFQAACLLCGEMIDIELPRDE